MSFSLGGSSDDFEADVAQAFEASVDVEEGVVDDLRLLEILVEVPDDDLLRVMGSYPKRVLAEIGSERRKQAERPFLAFEPTPLDALLSVAHVEAMSLSGAGTTISAVHVVLAMFSFPESASAEVLRRCGVEWRALRSLTRRLGSPRWNDW